MSKLLSILATIVTLAGTISSLAAEPARERHLFLPLDQLSGLLDGSNERMLLTKTEFDALLKKAKPQQIAEAPVKSVVLDADYTVTFETGRARIAAELQIELLADGLHAIDLPLSEVGLIRASLDGNPAAIGRAENGRFTLFASGRGQHRLSLELLTAVETSTSQQTLRIGLPRPVSARMALVVPGNVEIKSGAQVMTRRVDPAAGVTHFTINVASESMAIVLSLNNRQLLEQRLIVARCGIVDRLGPSEERLYASYSLQVLHRPTEQLRFAVPVGFDIAEVTSPQLARWTITGAGADRVLELTLRQPAIGHVPLQIQAVRTGPPQAWRYPALKPLDVASHTAVVGLWLDRLLQLEQLSANNLLAIDTGVIDELLAAQSAQLDSSAEQATAPGRLVAAFYAPTANVDLAGSISRRTVQREYESQFSLIATEAAWQLRGTFTLSTRIEPWFEVDLRLPADWTVEQITAGDGSPLNWQRREAADNTAIHVRLPNAITEATPQAITLTAKHVPADWLTAWSTRTFTVPSVTVEQADAKRGTLQVVSQDDMTIAAAQLTGLVPTTANDPRANLAAGAQQATAALNYRYTGTLPAAQFNVQKLSPQLSARSYSFYRVEANAIRVHTELEYQVERAHTRELSFALPTTTPAAISIRGLDGLQLKEFGSTDQQTDRVWRVALVEQRQGRLRLAIDYEMPLSGNGAEVSLPVVRVGTSVYQSGVLAIEGGADWNVVVAQHPKLVDVGELAGADERPGRHLIGTFAFAGEIPALAVKLDRPPEHGLPPALVARAAYTTLVSAQGLSQTAVELTIRAKVSFLEVMLPTGIDQQPSTLWSAELDGQTLKPQRHDQRLLVNLNATGDARARVLRLVYETPIAAIGHAGRLVLPGVILQVPDASGPFVVPVADVQWQLALPSGYRITHSHGSLTRVDQRPILDQLAAVQAVEVFALNGRFGLGPRVSSAREHARQSDVYFEGVAASDKPVAVQVDADMVQEFSSKREAAVKEQEMKSGEVVSKRDNAVRELGRPAEAAKSASTATSVATPAAPEPKAFASVFKNAYNDGVDIASRSRAGNERKKQLDLGGFRSLPIRIETTGDVVTFQSLGLAPELDVLLADGARHDALAWGMAAVIAVCGASLILRRSPRRFTFIVLVALIATLVPIVTGWHESVALVNPAFYAALGLIGLELLVGCGHWCLETCRLICGKCCSWWHTPTVVRVLALLMSAGSMTSVRAQEPLNPQSPLLVDLKEVAGPPVAIPADATVWLYEQAAGLGVPKAEKVLVPYDRYVALWNRANPERPLDLRPPTDYAPAGATYTATLDEADQLIVRGVLEYEVYVDRRVEVGLPLVGGVVAVATVNGEPARLKVVAPGEGAKPQASDKAVKTQQAVVNREQEKRLPTAMIAVLLEGKRRHRVELTLRFSVTRLAGWRVVEGRLPVHPASQLSLRVPTAQTELRLKGVADQAVRDTRVADETVVTALQLDQSLRIEWRPKAAATQRDETLQATSVATLLVQEDGVRSVWNVDLQFRGAPRDQFRFALPGEYQIEQVQGTNIRSWQSKTSDGRREIDVTLLAPATGSERVTIAIARSLTLGSQPQDVDAPVIVVPDAALHQGQLTVLRSEAIELKTTVATGVSRIDLSGEPSKLVEPFAAADRSPLGVVPVEAYRYSATPFQLRLAVATRAPRVAAEWHNTLYWTQHSVQLEAIALVQVADRALHQLELTLPAIVELDFLDATGTHEWSQVVENDRRRVRVFFARGHTTSFQVRMRGRVNTPAGSTDLALPQVQVEGVANQSTYYEVQSPVAWAIEASALQQLQASSVASVTKLAPAGFANPTVSAFRSETPAYSGQVAFKRKAASISCSTVTNLRVTPRSIEETTLFDYTIRDASVEQLTILLPERLREARLDVPVAAARQIDTLAERPGWVRVTLRFHDEVSGSLRLLLNHAGPLGASEIVVQPPIVEQSGSGGQFVVVENTGGAELKSDKLVGLEPLVRQQQDWNYLTKLFQAPPTEAYRVRAGATEASLTLTVVEHKRVETVAAQILLAQTMLVLDAHGAYRGTQTYWTDNKTEPYLIVELPAGAMLWSALVAGEPVKPVKGATPTSVKIPLIRTSEGDLDFPVVLKYGGSLNRLGTWSQLQLPFMHTANINVELSQVEVYLPEEHRWFGFEGSMRRMEDANEYQATSFSYQTKRTERLNAALSAGDEFTRIRAFNNSLKLQNEVAQQQSAQQATGNAYVQEQLDDNRRAVDELRSNTIRVERKLKENVSALHTNPFRLAEEYRNQTLIVNPSLGDVPTTTQPLNRNPNSQSDAAPGQKFDRSWLEGNKLSDQETDRRAGEKKQVDGLAKDAKGEMEAGKRAADKQQERGELRKSLAPASPSAPPATNAPTSGPMSSFGANAASKAAAAPASKGESLPTLQAPMAQEKEAVKLKAATESGVQPAKPDDVVNRYQVQQQVQLENRPGYAMPAGQPAREQQLAAAAPPAQGFASLDVELPQRGRVYRFTTTRGDLRLSARAVSRHWFESVSQFVLVIVGILVLGGIVRLLRSETMRGWLDSPWCSGALTLVGLLLMCSGLLPVIGLIAMLGGVGVIARSLRFRWLAPGQCSVN
ncbi:MAG: hypothetical protein JNM18_19370 [Planctomycetaceae bacterium]|nr:hypothetical protein [Planctomycetaceae bacterium]